MAAVVPPVSTTSLSQKQRRAALRRERRKKRRQAIAKKTVSDQPDCQEDDEGEGSEDDETDAKAEEERQRLHEQWLERERLAQEEFRMKQEKVEAAKRKKEEEENRIKAEWEEQQRKERESRDLKQQAMREREEAAQKMLDQAENELENGGPWRNPEAPAQTDIGTEKDRANCPFFLKTGACRFGDRCSRKHRHPASSCTLLIRGMFVHYGMEQSRRDDYDTDANLEYSEDEVHQQFLDFYEDVLPEFKSAGKVIQFKVSCNFEPHLRGNVYVQYATEEDCSKAFLKFNGRYYAGRQLQCEFSPVTRWKTAICGLFDRQKCPKGKHCNFLHVFRNPTREFLKADQDLHLSPDRDRNFTGRFSERSWSQRGHSPDRWSWRRSVRRSRSRERRSRSRSQESKRSRHGWYNKAAGQSGRPRRSRSRSRGRHRSRSRDRNGDRRSRERPPTTSRSASTSKSTEEPRRKSHRRDKEIIEDLTGAATTPLRHKHSKKSKKKKSKKKHKRKKSKSPGGSSSAESGKDTGDEGDDQLPAPQDEGSTDHHVMAQNEDSIQFSLTEEKEVANQSPSLEENAGSTEAELVLTDPEKEMIDLPDVQGLVKDTL
ncbi:hypothetical protein AALO_G00287470 [Alosa alosa]|uniref:Uncharacterized protein n=2 Tax=Alosa alosa TaxID=278164 RepID=A0AAV6FFY2_9TELE|nr:U2 small nuclear ribonucleoprotein auxiliary factor 35 kDa subunit-related protein 2 isoform X1 [Alosa alosa]KAG5261708.1 hypothetical protein AALO_G00287470 [Alosa alosa]